MIPSWSDKENWYDAPPVVVPVDIGQDSFSGLFRATNVVSMAFEINIGRGKTLHSVTITALEDVLGPVMLSVFINIGHVTVALGQPDYLADYAGYSARRFIWVGETPISNLTDNIITVYMTNYTGLVIGDCGIQGVILR